MNKVKLSKQDSPIGIFDSGIGGLTVVKEIIKILPNENIIYLGDTARVPYGTKSKETIIRYSIENTNFLLRLNIKLLVVACNTSSSYAIPVLKKILKPKNIPIIEVISPGVKKTIQTTKTYRIGVIGTSATVKSNSYKKAILKYSDNNTEVFQVACPLFVPLIEEGWIDQVYKQNVSLSLHDEFRRINHQNILKNVVSEYLLPLKQKNIDVLILGCTHYPVIKKFIQEVIGENVTIIDSAEETAKVVNEILTKHNLLSQKKTNGKIKFYVTDDPEKFKMIGSILIGKETLNVKKVNIEE